MVLTIALDIYGTDHSNSEPFKNRTLKRSVFEWIRFLNGFGFQMDSVFKWIRFSNGFGFRAPTVFRCSLFRSKLSNCCVTLSCLFQDRLKQLTRQLEEVISAEEVRHDFLFFMYSLVSY